MYNSWGINATCQCPKMARSSVDQNQKTDWTPFREFPRLFRKFPRLFREFPRLFLAIVFKNMECPNSPINTAAKQCHRLLKAFNHPTNSRWVRATMPHHKILWWDVWWSSDTCGNSDSFPHSLICSLASWRPKRPNKQTNPSILRIWRCSKNVFDSENISKTYSFGKTIFSKQIHKLCILMAA